MLELGNLNNNNTVVIVAGPTASGKSALAIDLALRYGGEIVNADSMQVYAGTSIISAAPSEEEKKMVPHYLYEIYPPSKNGTVVEWLKLAVAQIKEIWAKGKLPVVVGGTGLYIDNLINGTTPIPEPSADVREQVKKIDKIYAWLQENDAKAAQMLNAADKTRVRRAAEIFLQTGKSIAEWYKEPMVKYLPEADFKVIKILPPAKDLDERCYARFDKMIEQGALEEVRSLLDLRLPENLPVMKMLGVPELAMFLLGESSFEEAVALAKLHTRQYAKRQRTWFRNKLNAEYILDKICI
ncbi:MAG: tRNA (adenosine(37)-N6)-dimethylallyltransferase MiaA [Alphaproteobacteria bacterium]|nr:tRNA (adenosine(37)-N6)-dimethylallyltransferase MiaA [Alphaproteobacteria bacterium]